jgi:VCBS repeat-containing protein
MRSLIALGAIVAAVSSCTSSTETIDLSGTWQYSASFNNMAAITCNTSGATMTLLQAQGSAAVTGTYQNLNLTCTGVTPTDYGPFNGNILSGTIAGGVATITFDVTGTGGLSTSWQNTGHASNSSMSGSMVVVADFGSGDVTLHGTWTASK